MKIPPMPESASISVHHKVKQHDYMYSQLTFNARNRNQALRQRRRGNVHTVRLLSELQGFSWRTGTSRAVHPDHCHNIRMPSPMLASAFIQTCAASQGQDLKTLNEPLVSTPRSGDGFCTAPNDPNTPIFPPSEPASNQSSMKPSNSVDQDPLRGLTNPRGF